MASSAAFPWIPVWDDHEVADNTYRDGSSELNNTEASFVEDGGVSVDQRKMNAVRAYFEVSSHPAHCDIVQRLTICHTAVDANPSS